MWRLGVVSKVGVAAISGLLLSSIPVQAQYGGYSGGGGYPVAGYPPMQQGVAAQFGYGNGISAPLAPSYGGYQGSSVNQGGYFSTGAGVACAPGFSGYSSPAARQGYREGRQYWETGFAPNRPLSPAEARGFISGERRAAAAPWQLDPARQQGYREGQYYWETGIAPNRPLSPAEAQGFQAGERRAASGAYDPYR